MFDIFCCCLFCFFHISFSRSSRFLVFTVAVAVVFVVVTAAIKLMAYVCTFIYWVLYAFQSHENESNRQWRFGTKKMNKRKTKEDATFLSMFLCDFAEYGHLLYYYIVSIIVHDRCLIRF